MAKTSRLSTMLMLAAIHVGCTQVDYATPHRYRKGLVICLSGAGGLEWDLNRICTGLATGGVDYALEPFRWSRRNIITDLTNLPENLRQAEMLSRRIENYQAEYPGRPVWILGHSCGTGIAVWAAEGLQPENHLRGIVLISSSLDHLYDLTPALDRVDGIVHNFYSPADPMLGLAVRLARSVDRQGRISAGLRGFKPPADADPSTARSYSDKLCQRSWQFKDVFKGHLGGHLGATTSAFVSTNIAPLIREDQL